MPTLQTYMDVYLWNYVPNLPASIVFTAAFAILSALHTWKMVQHKMWFCIPFVIGGLCKYRHSQRVMFINVRSRGNRIRGQSSSVQLDGFLARLHDSSHLSRFTSGLFRSDFIHGVLAHRPSRQRTKSFAYCTTMDHGNFCPWRSAVLERSVKRIRSSC